MLLDNPKMSSNVQFDRWTADQVAEWLRGLDMDDAMIPYMHFFLNKGIDGKKLLLMTHADLERLNVVKLGHQELILEAIDLLRNLRYAHDSDNLQSLALQLGCKARGVRGELVARTGENDRNRANTSHRVLDPHPSKRLSIGILSSVADLVTTIKTLVGWMDKAPFSGYHDLCLIRNTIVKLGLDMITMCQKESTIPDVELDMINVACTLSDICEKLVIGSSDSPLDPLYVQPASLEQATIRKKQGEELGMHILSSYYGIHVISGIKELSPADLCGKIEKGDEVIQVNHQTVVGWSLKKLVLTLKEKPKEVILLLKKRPRHISPYGQMVNKKKQNMINKHHPVGVSTLPKSLKKLRSRDGEPKTLRPSLQNLVNTEQDADNEEDSEMLYSPKEATDGNDTDNDVFRSGSESPQFSLLPVFGDPKQRRATVSGGSPTFKRPLLVIEDIDSPSRPKSFTIGGTSLEMPDTTAGDNLSDLHKFYSAFEKRKEYKTKSTPSSLEFSVIKPKAKLSSNQPPQPLGTQIAGDTTITVHGPDSDIDSPPKLEQQDQKEGKEQQGEIEQKEEKGKQGEIEQNEEKGKQGEIVQKGETGGKGEIGQKEEKGQQGEKGGEIGEKEEITSDILVNKPADKESTEEIKFVYTPPRETQSPERLLDSSTDSVPPSESSIESSQTCISSLESSSHSPPLEESSLSSEKDTSYPEVFTEGVMTAPIRMTPPALRRPVHAEVATDYNKNQPMLVKIRKIDSFNRNSVESDQTKPEKHVGFTGVKPSADSDDNQSYEVRVIGGVVQKIPVRESPSGSPLVKRRPKPSRSRVEFVDETPSSKKIGSCCCGTVKKEKEKFLDMNRRVSCKDLGKGDCEGWLLKHKSKHSLMSQWQRRYCVIKDYNLFCYHDKESLKAEVVMHLPAFQISPVDHTELKTKKFAFKIHNRGTSFLLASDRKEDRTKWMNKMGLAAIAFHNNRDSTDSKRSDLSREDEAFSESENEDDSGHMSDGSINNSPKVARSKQSSSSLTNSPQLEHRGKSLPSSSLATVSSSGLSVPREDIMASQEDLSKMLRRQSQRGETIFGENKMKQRKSAISRELDDHSTPELLKFKRLKSLERTLKAKEKELMELDSVLKGKSLTKLNLVSESNTAQETDSD